MYRARALHTTHQIVDMQYVSHAERTVASLFYWKGIDLRRDPRYPRFEAWLRAWEARPSYLATKGDYYNHAMQLPSQYGY